MKKSIYALHSRAGTIFCLFLLFFQFSLFAQQEEFGRCNINYGTKLETDPYDPTIKFLSLNLINFKPILISKKVIYNFCIYFDPAEIDVNELKMEVDLDDGQGFKTTQICQDITLTYPNFGVKKVKIRVFWNGNEVVIDKNELIINLKTHPGNEGFDFAAPDLTLVVESGSFTPPVSGYYKNKYNENYSTKANAYIRFANRKTQYEDPLSRGEKPFLCSPVIFIEGLDFGDETYYISSPPDDQIIQYGGFGWPQFTLGISDDNPTSGEGGFDMLKLMPHQLKQFQEEGRDVILLDFEDGADWIQRNSQILQNLLGIIETMKKGCAHPEENIVIGASMGGQIARHAITKMEQMGKCHNTKLYVSFDSPHNGANIALGLQAAAWFNSVIPNPNSTAWDKLHKPAPQQLMFQTLESAVADGKVKLTNWGKHKELTIDLNQNKALRDQYKNEIKALGFPQLTRNIAIADGSEITTNQGYDHGSRYLRDVFRNNDWAFDGDVFQMAIAASPGEELHSKFDWKCETISDHDFTDTILQSLFTGFVPYDFNNVDTDPEPDAPCRYYAVTIEGTDATIKIDASSGGKRNGDFRIVHKEILNAYNKQKASNSDLELIDEYIRAHDHVCFIPTMSALAIDWEITNANLAKNIENEIRSNPNLTPFDDYYASNGNRDNGMNFKHVELTQGMIEWMEEQLNKEKENETAQLPHPKSGKYNFGYIKNIVESTEILSGGVLAINACGPTGLGNGPEAVHKDFSVRTACDAVIHVRAGGKLQIGDPGCQHTGRLFVSSGSKIIIHDGGELDINFGNSELVIEQGAELILEQGGIVHIADPLMSGDANSRIYIKGFLKWMGDILYSGNGHFRWAVSNSLYINERLKLEGMRKDIKLWHLDAGATVHTDKSTLDLRRGKINYEENSKIVNNNTTSFQDLLLVQDRSGGLGGVIPYLDNKNIIGLQATNYSLITMQNVHVQALEYGILATGTGTIDVTNGHFLGNNNGIFSTGSQLVSLNNSSFINSPSYTFARKAMLLKTCSWTKLNQCTVSNYNDFCSRTQQQQAVILTDCKLAQVNSTSFTNNCIGIHATLSNLQSLHSTFTNHLIAIKSEANSMRGLVDLACSKFFTNVTCVQGQDILLHIDNASPHRAGMSNTFGAGNNKYFDISYTKNSPNLVYGRLNYWEILPIKGLNYNIGAAPLVYDPVSSRILSCNIGAKGDDQFIDDTDCSVNMVNSTEPQSLNKAFQSPYEQLLASQFEPAILGFSSLLETETSSIVQNTIQCQDKINYAIAITEENPNLGERSSKNKKTKPYKELTIYPNPVEDQLFIEWPNNQATVSIYNATGVKLWTGTINSSYEINTGFLVHGVYTLELIDVLSGEKILKKFIK
ncbi:MAG TPA: T9SS type A sorting domain-containing protein [Saprospiraceae bacterium]|nr:T9SS type A sorting domain-containing protein [Saprospiraceae bacterium]